MFNYSKYKNRFWFIFNVIWTCIYLFWRIFYTVPFGYGIISLTAGLLLLIVELTGMLEAFVHYFNMADINDYKIPLVPLDLYPDVDVFIATYNEPESLLYKTVNGCINMEYPDREKVHIYICDDSRRSKIKKLAERMGVGYIDRENNEGAKAGNLNNAMSVTNSPLIATFDADMIPKHDFLMVTAAFFVHQDIVNRSKEESKKVKLGFVQSPQSFYNPDVFQYNLFSETRIPNEQDYFYKDIQISRNKSNSVIYGGSNTLLSREALESAGGFYTKSITEDFATGILIQKKGYKCLAISKVLASGISPDNLKALINQRIRWARGCISTGRQLHIILSKDLTASQKINYITSIWYWYASVKRLIYIISPILFAAFNLVVVRCTLFEVLIFWLPMYVSSNVLLRLLSRNIRSAKWTNVYETVMFPFLLVPVILETFGITMKKFKVTNKDSNKEDTHWSYSIFHLMLIVLSVIGIARCIIWTFDTGRMDYIVILFWLLINLYNLLMSVFIISGRVSFRKSERVFEEIDCVLKVKNNSIKCKTKNFSEGGLCIRLENPLETDEAEEIDFKLITDRYMADLKGKLVYTKCEGRSWLYSFKITSYTDCYNEYLHIIYDREPSLPTNLDESLSSFDDLKINLNNRIKNGYSKLSILGKVNNKSSSYSIKGNNVKSTKRDDEFSELDHL